MFCPKCGNSIKDGVSFCSKCGTQIKQTSVVGTGQEVSSEKKKEKGLLQKYINTWRERMVLDWTDKRKLLWFCSHAVVVFLCFLIVFGGSGDDGSSTSSVKNSIIKSKKEKVIRYDDYTMQDGINSVTAYLVGPFENGEVEIPSYITEKKQKYYVTNVMLAEEHKLEDGSVLHLVESTSQEEIEIRKMSLSGKKYDVANALSIDMDVMKYVETINVPHYTVVFDKDEESDTGVVELGVEKIVAAEVIVELPETITVPNLETIECSGFANGNMKWEVISLSGTFPSLQSVSNVQVATLDGTFPSLQYASEIQEVYLNGYFPALESLCDIKTIELHGTYPVLQEIEERNQECTYLELKGNFNQLRQIDIQGSVKMTVNQSKDYTYSSLETIYCDVIGLDVRVSTASFTESMIFGTKDDKTLEEKMVGYIVKSLPNLSSINMHWTEEKYEKEATDLYEFFENYLSKKISIQYEQ